MFEQLVNWIITFPWWLAIFLISLMPFLELRLSIPIGLLVLKQPWWIVFIFAVISNIILAPIVYFIWNKVIHWLRWIKFIDKLYTKTIERVQKKAKKYIDKYGELGLAVFIGIPLPGSGVWSGALAANIFNLKFRKYMLASIIGVVIAGIIVTIIMVTGTELFSVFIKPI
ncbi:MAG: small multi-drug export protein [Nanoarchaeota archaeon]|nr:small multi-drug export protein [Nanoarchaeota archaeon]MBU1321488.1 small multi-drug export protein [Nanoarchaeota archaeon]MBU1597372.1 small multi-drug export protein [Nanoarchaeota archaeon]MBU2441215.1 small multi-drug export protein [Nanoarchaeota archaeon]